MRSLLRFLLPRNATVTIPSGDHVVWVSYDGGRTWKEHTLTGIAVGKSAMVMGWHEQ